MDSFRGGLLLVIFRGGLSGVFVFWGVEPWAGDGGEGCIAGVEESDECKDDGNKEGQKGDRDDDAGDGVGGAWAV